MAARDAGAARGSPWTGAATAARTGTASLGGDHGEFFRERKRSCWRAALSHCEHPAGGRRREGPAPRGPGGPASGARVGRGAYRAYGHRPQRPHCRRRSAQLHQGRDGPDAGGGRGQSARVAVSGLLQVWPHRTSAARPHPAGHRDQRAALVAAGSACHPVRRSRHHRAGSVSQGRDRASQTARRAPDSARLLHESNGGGA